MRCGGFQHAVARAGPIPARVDVIWDYSSAIVPAPATIDTAAKVRTCPDCHLNAQAYFLNRIVMLFELNVFTGYCWSSACDRWYSLKECCSLVCSFAESSRGGVSSLRLCTFSEQHRVWRPWWPGVTQGKSAGVQYSYCISLSELGLCA